MTTEAGVMLIEKIVSGGQTGVDRGALDAAIAAGVPHGGWCPKGRLAEDGPIADSYRLLETNSTDYAVRTERNVVDSDGTLILYRQRLAGGTLLTQRMAQRHGQPLLRVRLDRSIPYALIVDWIAEHEIKVLNVAGPRGSSDGRLYQQAFDVISHLLRQPGQLPLVSDT
jgi:hypothetical protein